MARRETLTPPNNQKIYWNFETVYRTVRDTNENTHGSRHRICERSNYSILWTVRNKPHIRDHRVNGKIERLVQTINERLRTNEPFILSKDKYGLSEILYSLGISKTKDGKLPFEKHMGKEPNTIKSQFSWNTSGLFSPRLTRGIPALGFSWRDWICHTGPRDKQGFQSGSNLCQKNGGKIGAGNSAQSRYYPKKRSGQKCFQKETSHAHQQSKRRRSKTKFQHFHSSIEIFLKYEFIIFTKNRIEYSFLLFSIYIHWNQFGKKFRFNSFCFHH